MNVLMITSGASVFFHLLQLNAANEPVLPLSSIRRAAHVYVHGTFGVAPAGAEESDDIADETLALESRLLKSRGESGDMEASRADSSVPVSEEVGKGFCITQQCLLCRKADTYSVQPEFVRALI